ncbi:HNH nuclease [Oxalobacteraceae bacterium]
MQLKNFLDDNVLNSFRKAMGAPLSLFQINIQLPPPVFKPRPSTKIVLPLPTEGLEVDSGAISVYQDGTLVYNDKRVLVHIRDATHHEPRFHFSNCITLVDMRSQGRFEKYVVSESTDGSFFIRIGAGPLRKKKLSVCQNCLDHLSWRGFSRDSMPRSTRLSIVDGFSIKDFFAKYPNSLHPTLPLHSVDSAPINDYPENWSKIASELKRQLGFYCQSCKRVIGEANKQFLHVHHINGLKNDCRVENLRCLCIECHAGQPNHQNLRTNADYAEFRSIFNDK